MKLSKPPALSTRGGILIITAFSAVFILGMTALVTDIGFVYFNQSRLQTAVDASWKAGFDSLLALRQQGVAVPDAYHRRMVTQQVREVMTHNGYSAQELEALNVSIGPGTKIEVSMEQNVGLFFARILDIDFMRVSASRAQHPDFPDMGVVPFAIPHGEVYDIAPRRYNVSLFDSGQGFNEGEEYIIKLGEADDDPQRGDVLPFGIVPIDDTNADFGYVVGEQYEIKSSPGGGGLLTPGNFGLLRMGGAGANVFRNNVKYGYDGEVEIGSNFTPQPGNVAGPTIDSINYRIDNGMIDVTIPVVVGYGAGASADVTVIGFLNFRLIQTGVEGRGNNAKASVIAEYLGTTYEDPDAEGFIKNNFGVVNLHNDRSVDESEQYVDGLKHGFESAIDIDDRLVTIEGNMAAETQEAVDFKIHGDAQFQPSRTVIVPITAVGDEIAQNNPDNADAQTIYDLQGQDDPGGTYDVNEYSFGSAVRVIGFAEFEIIEESEYQREELGEYYEGQVRGRFIRYIVEPGTI